MWEYIKKKKNEILTGKVKTLGASDWEEASGHFKVDNAKVPLGSLGLGCVHLLYLFWTYT